MLTIEATAPGEYGPVFAAGLEPDAEATPPAGVGSDPGEFDFYNAPHTSAESDNDSSPHRDHCRHDHVSPVREDTASCLGNDRGGRHLISHSDLMPAGSFENVSLRDACSSSSTSGANPAKPDTEISDTQEPPGNSQSQQLMVKRLTPREPLEPSASVSSLTSLTHLVARKETPSSTTL
jgi:hypothetical protein